MTILGTLLGGWTASSMAARGARRQRLRQLYCFLSFAVGAGFLWSSIAQQAPLASAALAAVSTFAVSSYQAHWWACVTELSGKHLGALFGLLNGLGAFGAMASLYLFGRFSDWRKDLGYLGRDQYDPALYVYVGVLALAALCWLGIDTSRPIAHDDNMH